MLPRELMPAGCCNQTHKWLHGQSCCVLVRGGGCRGGSAWQTGSACLLLLASVPHQKCTPGGSGGVGWDAVTYRALGFLRSDSQRTALQMLRHGAAASVGYITVIKHNVCISAGGVEVAGWPAAHADRSGGSVSDGRCIQVLRQVHQG